MEIARRGVGIFCDFCVFVQRRGLGDDRGYNRENSKDFWWEFCDIFFVWDFLCDKRSIRTVLREAFFMRSF